MKKVVGLAAAGLLAVSTAKAGQITVANTDITVFGGVSAAYSGNSNDHVAAGTGFSKDRFSVNNVIIGLTKPAQDGGIGFTAAFGMFEAPTVVASSNVVNNAIKYYQPTANGDIVAIKEEGLIGYGKTTDFKPWLAFVTYKPVAGLTLDAGLLWTNFGERPITILNPHITRGVLFTANPVLLEGARATYDAGVVKVYVGMGKAGDYQLMGPVYQNPLFGIKNYYSNYIEAGVTANLKNVANIPVDVGLHTYNENGNRDIYALTVGSDFGIVTAGLEFDYFKADDGLKKKVDPNGSLGIDDSAYGAALCLNVKPMAQVQIPVRIEYADNKNSPLIPVISDVILGTNQKKVWTFTITPTYNPTKNTFLRAELAYAKSSGTIYSDQEAGMFVNSSGERKTSMTQGAIELGFLF